MQYKLFCGTHVSVGDWFPNTLGAELDWNRRTTDLTQPDFYKPTNADRIRGMSDEELGRMIIGWQKSDPSVNWCKDEYGCAELGEAFDCTDVLQIGCIIRWLQQPVEE